MRLPVLKGADGRPDFKQIDYPAATAMLHRAIDGGVNYVDTAWMYHENTSETWVGEALKGGYREKVKLATKMPVWEVKQPGVYPLSGGTMTLSQALAVAGGLTDDGDAAHIEVIRHSSAGPEDRTVADLDQILALQKPAVGQGNGFEKFTSYLDATSEISSHPQLATFDKAFDRATQPDAGVRMLGFTVLFALLFLFIYVAVYLVGGAGGDET